MDRAEFIAEPSKDPRALVPGMRLPGGTPISNDLKPFDRDPSFLVWEGYGNDRFVRLSVRPGMEVGQYLALSLQRWGAGKEFVAQGGPMHVSKEADAKLWALRFVEAGR